MKFLKKRHLISLPLMVLLLFSACVGRIDPDEFYNKKTITFSVYDGGYGTLYAEQLAARFNAERTDDYAIKILPEKRSGEGIVAELRTGVTTAQGYIFSGVDIMPAVHSGMLADLSDMLDVRPDGEDGKSIRQKILRADDWNSVFSTDGENLFALPYSDSIQGMVYDHQLFVSKGWYEFANAAEDGAALTAQGIVYTQSGQRLKFSSSERQTNLSEGDFILKPGKDGIYGTYDDGQPVTEAGWEMLVKRIYASDAYPFIWAMAVETYMNPIITGLIAQYQGVDDFNTIFTYDSNGKEIELFDGSKLVFDVTNGWRVHEISGVYKILQFVRKYFTYAGDSQKYLHPATVDGTKSHFDAQNLFLLGYMNDRLNKLSAMLMEGAWWENEARNMFNSLSEVDASRGYGAREYRFMLLPDIEGQSSDTTVFAAGDTGCVFAAKDTNAERLAVTKEFIAYLLKEESLRYFTTQTGSLLAYDYELTESDKTLMTPFSKNMYELYFDNQNITIIRPLLLANISPLSYASRKGGMYSSLVPKLENAYVSTQVRALRLYGFEQTWQGLKNAYTQSEWNTFIQQAKSQGFYKDL